MTLTMTGSGQLRCTMSTAEAVEILMEEENLSYDSEVSSDEEHELG